MRWILPLLFFLIGCNAQVGSLSPIQNIQEDNSIDPYNASVIIPPSSRTYYQNQTLDFLVPYNEKVHVSGTPRLTLIVGGNTTYANYISGTNSL